MSRHHDRASPPGRLSVRSARSGDSHVVIAEGELDLATAPELEAELKRVQDTDAAEIVIDLGGLLLIDSIGLGVLLHAHRRAQFQRKRLVIVGGERVQQRLEVTGLATRLPFVSSPTPPGR